MKKLNSFLNESKKIGKSVNYIDIGVPEDYIDDPYEWHVYINNKKVLRNI